MRKERNNLQSLPESHLITQYTVQSVLIQGYQPLYTIQLVIPHGSTGDEPRLPLVKLGLRGVGRGFLCD